VFRASLDMMAQDRMSRYQLPWLVAMPAENAAVDPVVDPVGRLRGACRARSSCASRHGRRQLSVPSRAGSTMRGATAMSCARTAAVCRPLRRPVLCRCRRVQRRRTRVPRQDHGRRPRHARFRLSLPARGATGRSLIRSHETLPMPTREKLLHANATAFFGLDAGRSALSGAAAARRSA